MGRPLRRLTFNLSYLFKPPWDTGIPAPELVRFVEASPPGKALELGCGTGTNSLYLAQRQWEVTGIDFAPLAVRAARRKIRGLPAKVMVADVTKLSDLPLEGPFDLALDIGCFHSLAKSGREGYAGGLGKWLRRGGTYLVYAFQPDAARPVRGISKEEMAAYFQDGFTLVNYEQGQGWPSAWYTFERR